MDENRLPELPQEAFRPMIAQSVQLEQFLGEELTFCFRDLDGAHTFTTCYIDAAVKQTKRLKQISDAAFQRQDIDEIESLALALRKEIEAALQPFYMGHMCLYVTPECFDDPPKTPEIYNDATACVWRDGTWQLLEDTSKGFLLFVQSKSKEESAA